MAGKTIPGADPKQDTAAIDRVDQVGSCTGCVLLASWGGCFSHVEQDHILHFEGFIYTTGIPEGLAAVSSIMPSLYDGIQRQLLLHGLLFDLGFRCVTAQN